VIERGDQMPTITNDGLTISREIQLEDPFENLGVQLVREAAIRTGDVAGDGTTTATLLAHGLVSRGLQVVESRHNPVAVRRGMERAVDVVVESLRHHRREIGDRADLVRVATSAAGGDLELGEVVAEAMERVGRSGLVTVDSGHSMSTTLDVVEGVQIDRGYLSPYFINEPDDMRAVLENALVLVTDLKLTTARELLSMLERVSQLGQALLIVADDVEGEALATLVVNRLRGRLSCAAIRAPEIGDRRRELLEDLATVTGARLITSDEGVRLDRFEDGWFGRAGRIMIERDSTTIVEGGGAVADIRSHAARLRRALGRATSEFDRNQLKARLARLDGAVARIRVGAATEFEMLEKKARLEDSLAATRAAVEEGVVPGGGVALIRAEKELRSLGLSDDEEAGVRVVRQTLADPAAQIAENAGEQGPVIVEKIRAGSGWHGFDAATLELADLDTRGILDPVKVTRVALQNAASIGALMVTTDAIVVEAPSDEEPREE